MRAAREGRRTGATGTDRSPAGLVLPAALLPLAGLAVTPLLTWAWPPASGISIPLGALLCAVPTVAVFGAFRPRRLRFAVPAGLTVVGCVLVATYAGAGAVQAALLDSRGVPSDAVVSQARPTAHRYSLCSYRRPDGQPIPGRSSHCHLHPGERVRLLVDPLGQLPPRPTTELGHPVERAWAAAGSGAVLALVLAAITAAGTRPGRASESRAGDAVGTDRRAVTRDPPVPD